MAEQKTSKPTKRLFEYADNYKYLTIASWVLATVSAFIALVPFYYIWRLIKEVIRVSPDFDRAQNLSAYGWCAVESAVLAMLIYMGGLICSHLAAFHVQATMRSRLMRHIMSLPLGFMDKDGSGKVRKIVNESSAATETYLAHQLPDKCVATATPIGLVVLLLVFDWRLGLLSLIPVVLGFAIMSTMMGANMKKKMEEYQNALEEMSSEAVEYVRGIPVVKTFGQSVFCLYKGSENPDDGTYDSNQFRVCDPDRSNLLAGRSEKWKCRWYVFAESYVLYHYHANHHSYHDENDVCR